MTESPRLSDVGPPDAQFGDVHAADGLFDGVEFDGQTLAQLEGSGGDERVADAESFEYLYFGVGP